MEHAESVIYDEGSAVGYHNSLLDTISLENRSGIVVRIKECGNAGDMLGYFHRIFCICGTLHRFWERKNLLQKVHLYIFEV